MDVSPASVDVGSTYGWSNNRPVHLATLPSGGAKVAWSGGRQVHVTPLDAALRRAGPDVVVAGVSVRGFVAHADGAVALLVVRGTSMVLEKLRAECHTRRRLIPAQLETPLASAQTLMIEAETGGAIIYLFDVERFETL